MGFFKSLLDDAIDKSLSMADIDKAKARSALSSLSSILKQQAPPAVPEVNETMSVMIAVNGQSYGPYERTTLLQMINNGTLTRETYVFIQGMSGWKAASEVPQVAKLFELNAPTPAAPPVPWQSAPQPPTAPAASAQATTYDNSLSPRLNSLINAAVADGEISDMERNVLIRNAQQEGVSMDEFVMILEARLYEQQQALRARQQEAENKQKAAAAVNAAPIPVRPSRPELRKCPACGEIINDLFTSKCNKCGYDLDHTAEKTSESSWERLTAKIEEVRSEYAKKKGNILTNNIITGILTGSDPELEERERIASIISSFPVPSGKQDMLDFFTSCTPLAKAGTLFGGGDIIETAYYAKAQQVLIKARIVMKDDKGLLEQMEAIARQYKIKA